jgi:SLT domain-containing protein
VSRWGPIVAQVLGLLGQPVGLTPDVLQLISFESGGNPNAINLTDVNALAGNPSQGLTQTTGSTFAGNAGPYLNLGIDNPLANIYAGLHYGISRYGSITAIPGIQSLLHGGPYLPYDEGGYLPPGITTVFNGTGRPEPVLTSQQLSAVASGTQGGDGAATLGLLREQNLLLRRIISEVPEGVGRHVLAGIDGQIDLHDRELAQVANAGRAF